MVHKPVSSPNTSTKIVCTIGPASSSVATLEKMIAGGMRVARFNFSHGSYESNLSLVEKVRDAALTVGQRVAILLDLQGPKIRVGDLPPDGFLLIEDSLVTLHTGVANSSPDVIPVPYDRLAHDVRRGDRILLDDGILELEVVDVRGSVIQARVILGGRLLSHKGINVPTVTLSIESMTAKDNQDLVFGLKQNIDFVALSFVRNAADVRQLRDKIKKHMPKGVVPPAIVVKIEKHEALENFDAILEEADAVMVARGDLGLETPATRVPHHQKELIAKCVVACKPIIVATHMLDSMTNSPRPTRAEVSDVANAVLDHTDAVMLSGESAMGKYPVQAVEFMAKIVDDTEESPIQSLIPHQEAIGESVPTAVAAGAVELAWQIKAAAILVTTHSGYSARAIARFRPRTPIFAATDLERTAQQLQLTWGVNALSINDYERPEKMVGAALRVLLDKENVKAGDKVIVVSGLKRPKGGYDSAVRIMEI